MIVSSRPRAVREKGTVERVEPRKIYHGSPPPPAPQPRFGGGGGRNRQTSYFAVRHLWQRKSPPSATTLGGAGIGETRDSPGVTPGGVGGVGQNFSPTPPKGTNEPRWAPRY